MKRQRSVTVRPRFLAAAMTAGLGVLAGTASAAPFTAGNFLNYRIGNPADASVTFAGTVPVFVDEYTPAGRLVQSIAMPTDATSALTASTSTTEGNISLSTDNRYLVIGGYRKVLGATGPNGDASTTTPRVIGRVAMDGTFDTSTALTDAFSAGNIRGVASTDGSHFWISGSNGVRYVASLGATTSTAINSNNVRAEQIYDNTLYESTAATTTHGIRVYSGLPTSSAQPTALAANDAFSYQGFAMFDASPTIAGVDTLYVTRLDTTPNPQQGYIDKFVKQADGTWVAKGEATAVQDLFYLAGALDPATGNVNLYASSFTNGTAAKIVSLTDTSGFGGTLSGTPTTIVTGVANEGFRGLAVVAPEPGSVSLMLLPVVSLLARRRGRFLV